MCECKGCKACNPESRCKQDVCKNPVGDKTCQACYDRETGLLKMMLEFQLAVADVQAGRQPGGPLPW